VILLSVVWPPIAGFKNPVFKAQLAGFWGFYWVVGSFGMSTARCCQIYCEYWTEKLYRTMM